MHTNVARYINLCINFYIALMITNGPRDITVCSGNTVDISCGFSGATPQTTFPNWRIIRRSNDGSVTSNTTISGNEIITNNDDGLVWVPDTATGGINAPNGVLRVGPVDETYNQSSYQCSITSNDSSVVSSMGTFTVIGEYVYNGERRVPRLYEDLGYHWLVIGTSQGLNVN